MLATNRATPTFASSTIAIFARVVTRIGALRIPLLESRANLATATTVTTARRRSAVKKSKKEAVKKGYAGLPDCIVSQHILFDGVVIAVRAVDLGDRDLRRVLIVALPPFGRLLHFAHLALGGRVHYTVYVRHLCVLLSSAFCRCRRRCVLC